MPNVAEIQWLLRYICPRAHRERYIALLSNEKLWGKFSEILNHTFVFSETYVVCGISNHDVTRSSMMTDKPPFIFDIPLSKAIAAMDEYTFGSLVACQSLGFGCFKPEAPSCIVYFKVPLT